METGFEHGIVGVRAVKCVRVRGVLVNGNGTEINAACAVQLVPVRNLDTKMQTLTLALSTMRCVNTASGQTDSSFDE